MVLAGFTTCSVLNEILHRLKHGHPSFVVKKKMEMIFLTATFCAVFGGIIALVITPWTAQFIPDPWIWLVDFSKGFPHSMI